MPLPHESATRLAALRATGLLGPDTSPLLDSLARLAVRLLDVPMAAVSLVDDRQQWWVGYVDPTATVGPASASPAVQSFCREVVERAAPVVVHDTLVQSSVSGGTTRTVRAYAGVPLTLRTGQTLGALCATDSEPRTWDDGDVRILEDLARAAVAELELRIALTARISSEARFTGIIDSATDAILTTDEAQRIVLVNPAAEQLFGYPAHELIGQQLDMLVPESQRSRHRAHVEQFAADGTSTRAIDRQRAHESAPLSARRRDGSTFPIDASISQVVTDEGRLFTVILRDASARVSVEEARARAEESLRDSEERLRLAIVGSDLGTWHWDLRTGALDWSERCLTIFGIPPRTAMTYETFLGALHPEDRARADDAVRGALQDGSEYRIECRTVWPDGSEHWAVSLGRAYYDTDGAATRMEGIAFDITERKRVEIALHESERHYRALATATSDVSYRMSADWSTMLPLDGRDLVASSEASLADWAWLNQNIPTDEHPRVRQAISEAVAQQALFELEHRVRRPDGSVGWTRFRAVPILDANGTVTSWFGTASNITDSRNAQEELRASDARNSFLVTLADALRPLSDPIEIQVEASRVLGEWLGANRVAYFEVHGDEYVVRRDFTNAAPSIVGCYPVSSFGLELLAVYRAGRTATESNVDALPLTPNEMAAYASLQIRSYIGVPLIKDGQFVAGFAVHTHSVRQWTPAEIAIAEATAERTWAAVERARAEEALRDSEARAQVLFRDSPIPMWVFDLDTLRIKDVNNAAVLRYGYEREEFCQLSATALRSPEDVQRFLASVAEPRHAIAHVGVFRHQTKHGEVFDVEVTAQETSYNHRPARIVLAMDITERRRAEEALRRSEERYALAARATANAIWDWDLATDVLTWGDGAAAVTGYDGAIGAALSWWTQRVHPDDRERVLGTFQPVLAAASDTNEWRESYRFRREDGAYINVTDRCSVVRDVAGCGVRMIGALEDTTAQISLEAQLRQAQKMEAVGRLAGGVAHDFNNLLTIMLGNLSMVESELAVDHPARPELEEVGMAADRASTLVRQLLTFSRQQPVRPEEVHITDVVQHAEKLLRRVIGDEIMLTLSLTDEPTLVRADPGQLDQVLMNLAVNARDAMLTPLNGHAGRGGTLHIEVDALTLTSSDARDWEQLSPGRWVRLVVRDSGHGMDMETQAHLFEPFFTTKAVGTGTGLGLSTVFGIVHQSGGAMRVDSRLGQGSAFTILLPALRLTTSGDAHASKTMPVSVPSVSATVLLVEDESAVRVTARRMLERCGYTVLEAQNGADALVVWRAYRDQIDVVVTDQRMPELGGRELVAHLLADRPALPVVMMSGYSQLPATPASHRHVVTLDKPFNVAGLLAAIATAVQSVGQLEVMAPDV